MAICSRSLRFVLKKARNREITDLSQLTQPEHATVTSLRFQQPWKRFLAVSAARSLARDEAAAREPGG